MADEVQSGNGQGWLEASGLRHLMRTLGFAAQPAKLSLAFLALVLTCILGGLFDYLAWTWGGYGVTDTAIVEYTMASRMDQPYTEPEGDVGIFKVWRQHQQRCVVGLLTSVVPGATPPPELPSRSWAGGVSGFAPLSYLTSAVYANCWLLRHHFFFALIFGIGTLLIWSWAGGAICRMVGMQFARDERITTDDALVFARKNLFGGFFLAPCIPLILILVTVLLMSIGGAVLRIPVIGDLLGGLAFVFALLGGFVIAVLVVGGLLGGSLFWPSIATECQDAYDAFSRGFSYAFSKPWKTALYVAIATVYAGLCWLVLKWFVSLMLQITHAVVSFGTGPFGWWNRGTEDTPLTKLELIWPSAGGFTGYSWPTWGELAWYEYFSAAMIGIYVLVALLLMWSFLASFYFSASTVVYFLLRRDVDGIDLSDVQIVPLDQEPPVADSPVEASTTVTDSPVEAPTPVTDAPVEATTPVADSEEETGDSPDTESKPTEPQASGGDEPATDESQKDKDA